MYRPLLAAAVASCCLFAPLTVAQAQSAAEIQSASTRLNREVPCLQRQQERLQNTLRLLQEARNQLAQTGAGEAARRDAVHSAEALELRLGVIVGELRMCLGQAGSTTNNTANTTPPPSNGSGTNGTGTSGRPYPPRVVVRHQDDGAGPPTPAPHPAERPNPATQVIDESRVLQTHVRVERGERVDGAGHADPAAVRSAITNVSPRFERCYQQLVERGALQTGRVYLTFTVTSEGRIRDIRLENFTIYERSFQRCVGAAAGRLYVGQPAVGGSARYSFFLRFGPQ